MVQEIQGAKGILDVAVQSFCSSHEGMNITEDVKASYQLVFGEIDRQEKLIDVYRKQKAEDGEKLSHNRMMMHHIKAELHLISRQANSQGCPQISSMVDDLLKQIH